MQNQHIHAIIFDFDGVILDSADIKTNAFVSLFQSESSHVQNLVKDLHLSHEGISRFVKFQMIYETILHKPLTQETSNILSAQFNKLIDEKIKKTSFIQGAYESIEILSKKIPIYIASGTPQTELHKIVQDKKIDHFFQGIYGTPDTKPDIINRILSNNTYDRNKTYMIGDAISDCNAASDCKVKFIGIVPDDEESMFPRGTTVIHDLTNFHNFLAKESKR